MSDCLYYSWNWKKPLTLVRVYRGIYRPRLERTLTVDFSTKEDTDCHVVIRRIDLPEYEKGLNEDGFGYCFVKVETLLGLFRPSYKFELVPKIEVTREMIERCLAEVEDKYGKSIF